MLISCTLRHRYAIHTSYPSNGSSLRPFRKMFIGCGLSGKKYIAGICAGSDDGDLPVAHRSPISCELCL